MKEVLFICTGNYYRSRFAEGLFNHLCAQQPISWRAFSRGLAIHWVLDRSELSPFILTAFARMGIDHQRHCAPRRSALSKTDLQRATRSIALKRSEHHPMMRKHFPHRADEIEYWDIHDINYLTSRIVLPQIEERVRELYTELATVE